MRLFCRKFYLVLLTSALAVFMVAIPAAADEIVDNASGEELEVPSEVYDDFVDISEEGEAGVLEEAFSDEGTDEEVWTEDFREEDISGEDIQEEVYYIEAPEISDDVFEEEDADVITEEDSEEDFGIAVYDVVVQDADEVRDNGFYQDPDGGDWYYYVDGKIASDRNDVIQGIVNGTDGWWYVVGGKVQFGYTGVANYSNSAGWWYIKDGKVDFSANTVAQNNYGWWYVVDGKVQFGYTGVANHSNSAGWWYIKNGKVDFSANTVAQNNYGWWYVVGGKVQFGYTGVANHSNSAGWWYIKEGKVDFSANTVAQNNYGWWYVVGGKVQFGYTGVANHSNSAGWWYIKEGKVDFSANTLAQNNYGWWYVKEGKVDFSANTVAQNDYGWWYVVGGKVQFGYTGVANYSNSAGWWYIKEGKVDFSANTVAKNDYGWWYVEGGKVIFSFNGIAKNSDGWWYIKDGKVDFSYNGSVTVAAGTYSVADGKVQNINITDAVSSSLKDSDDSGDGSDPDEYEVPEEDIKYSGTDTNTLAAPQFTGSVNSNGVMTLSWEPVSGASKYRVLIREYSNGGWGEWTTAADTTSTSYTGNVWTESKLYQYTVRCLDSSGNYASPYISGYSGSAVAEYAQLFVGNPYKYGGSSLTNGCDCSGFIMQVYAHFGIFLPHQSGVQITLGREVAYADMQPGDIIGRSGHTMIYIGDGKVVHAQDSQHGITISDVSNMSYTNIRRIF